MKREARIKELQNYITFMNNVVLNEDNINIYNEEFSKYKKLINKGIEELNDLIMNRHTEVKDKTRILILEEDFGGIVNTVEKFVDMLGVVGLNQRRTNDDITLENNSVKVEIVKVSKNYFADDKRPNWLEGKRYNFVINNSNLDSKLVKTLIK